MYPSLTKYHKLTIKLLKITKNYKKIKIKKRLRVLFGLMNLNYVSFVYKLDKRRFFVCYDWTVTIFHVWVNEWVHFRKAKISKVMLELRPNQVEYLQKCFIVQRSVSDTIFQSDLSLQTPVSDTEILDTKRRNTQQLVLIRLPGDNPIIPSFINTLLSGRSSEDTLSKLLQIG